MIKEVFAALNEFWRGFELNAYVTNNVFDALQDGETVNEATPPYITYDVAVGKTLGSTPLGARLWYKYGFPPEMLDKADEIHERIKNGVQLPCGNGYLVLYPGEPFAQPVTDEDDRFSTLYLNITAEYDLN